jgi:hypothetical protein
MLLLLFEICFNVLVALYYNFYSFSNNINDKQWKVPQLKKLSQ